MHASVISKLRSGPGFKVNPNARFFIWAMDKRVESDIFGVASDFSLPERSMATIRKPEQGRWRRCVR